MSHKTRRKPIAFDLVVGGRANGRPRSAACLVLSILLIVATAENASAQPGSVLSHQKISDTQGGFTGTIDNSDWFGFSVVALGDLDDDGVGDIAVGA